MNLNLFKKQPNLCHRELGDNARKKMNKAFFLGLHSLFLSLKQRHQIIFNYSGKSVFSTFDYRLAYGGRGKAQRPRNFSTCCKRTPTLKGSFRA